MPRSASWHARRPTAVTDAAGEVAHDLQRTLDGCPPSRRIHCRVLLYEQLHFSVSARQLLESPVEQHHNALSRELSALRRMPCLCHRQRTVFSPATTPQPPLPPSTPSQQQDELHTHHPPWRRPPSVAAAVRRRRRRRSLPRQCHHRDFCRRRRITCRTAPLLSLGSHAPPSTTTRRRRRCCGALARDVSWTCSRAGCG